MDNAERKIQLVEDLTEIARNNEISAKRLFRLAEKLFLEKVPADCGNAALDDFIRRLEELKEKTVTHLDICSRGSILQGKFVYASDIEHIIHDLKKRRE